MSIKMPSTLRTFFIMMDTVGLFINGVQMGGLCPMDFTMGKD
jgi:hypothetical protein